MTVEEERQAIGQMDVDAQVVAKSSRSGGQGRSGDRGEGAVEYVASPEIIQERVR